MLSSDGSLMTITTADGTVRTSQLNEDGSIIPASAGGIPTVDPAGPNERLYQVVIVVLAALVFLGLAWSCTRTGSHEKLNAKEQVDGGGDPSHLPQSSICRSGTRTDLPHFSPAKLMASPPVQSGHLAGQLHTVIDEAVHTAEGAMHGASQAADGVFGNIHGSISPAAHAAALVVLQTERAAARSVTSHSAHLPMLTRHTHAAGPPAAVAVAAAVASPTTPTTSNGPGMDPVETNSDTSVDITPQQPQQDMITSSTGGPGHPDRTFTSYSGMGGCISAGDITPGCIPGRNNQLATPNSEHLSQNV
jgi:hypothetical protein